MKILSKKKYSKLIEDFEELQKKVKELKRINESIEKELEDKKTSCKMNNGKDFCFKCENSYRYKAYWGGTEYENSTDIKVHLEFCTNCKRAYSNEEDREFHEDKYRTID